MTRLALSAWLPLFCVAAAVAAQPANELYSLSLSDTAACGTFFDQQAVALAHGDAIFKRGRCIDRWIAAEARVVALPPPPVETVQSALAGAPDGSIYLSGGRSYFGDPRFTSVDAKPRSSVYVWSVGSAAWTAGPSLDIARAKHASVTLPDGRILVIGGEGAPASGRSMPTLSAVESLDPAGTRNLANIWGLKAAAWRPAPSLAEARARPAALVTRAGDVVVIGGESSGRGLSSVEILRHGGHAWQPLAPMREGRYAHTGTLLADGRILVTGGLSGRDRGIDRAEVWAPTPAPLGSWSSAGTVSGGARANHSATLLEDGRVLVIGGVVADGQLGLSSTAIWNPRDGSWQSDATLPEAPYFQVAFLQDDHSIAVLSATLFQKLYNTNSTLAYRYRLLADRSAIDLIAEQAIAKGSVLPPDRDALTAQDRAAIVARLLQQTGSDNHATCSSAWDALESVGGAAYAEVIARAAAVLNTVSCGASPRSILALLESAPEPLSPFAADQIAVHLEAKGDRVTLAQMARNRKFSLAAIGRWLAPGNPRLSLAFEWLIAPDTLRFDATLLDLAGLVEAGFDRLGRDDAQRYAALASPRASLAAKASALPMREVSNNDGLPRDVEMRKAALYALDLSLIFGASAVDSVARTEAELADKLASFVRENRPYLVDAREIGTVVPGPGAPTFRMLALGSAGYRSDTFSALRVLRPARIAPAPSAALAWDIFDEDGLAADDIDTPLDGESGYRNVTVRTTTPQCQAGRTTLRYVPARQEFAAPVFTCLRTHR